MVYPFVFFHYILWFDPRVTWWLSHGDTNSSLLHSCSSDNWCHVKPSYLGIPCRCLDKSRIKTTVQDFCQINCHLFLFPSLSHLCSGQLILMDGWELNNTDFRSILSTSMVVKMSSNNKSDSNNYIYIYITE